MKLAKYPQRDALRASLGTHRRPTACLYLKIGGMVLVALFVVITAVGYLLPSHRVVTRSIEIDAPPESIYPLIANLEEGWPKWSPWEEESPQYKSRYSGPKEGVGATLQFEDSGANQLTIVKADPKSGVEYDLLLMNESFRLKGSLLCQARGQKTEVTWSGDVDYDQHPYYRYFGLIIDEPLGAQMDKGLLQLKREIENQEKKEL